MTFDHEAFGRAAPPLLSVVVLSWDGPELTERCVEAVRANTHAAYELIVVDNGSTEYTRRLCESIADVAVLNERNLGFSGGMNRGLAVATGDFVAFLNNDTVVPPGWDEQLLEHLRDPDVGMVVPAVTAAGNALTVRATAGTRARLLRPFAEVPSAAAVLLRTTVMRELGGWDERYFPASAEDAELAFSLWVNGLTIVFDEAVLVEHMSKGTTRVKLPTWRRVWHENGRRFLERWADEDQPVPQLAHTDGVLWAARRREAAATARGGLREVRRQDQPLRRWYRNGVAPALEWLRARRTVAAGPVASAGGKPQTDLAYVTLHGRVRGQGAETHVEELTRALGKRGWQVRTYRCAPSSGSAPLSLRLAEMLRVQFRLVRDRRPPAAVYVRHHPLSALVTFWSLLRRVQRVEEVNGTLEDWYVIHPATRRFRVLFAALSWLNLRTASGVVAVSPDLAAWAATNGARSVTVVPNGVDPARFAPDAAASEHGDPYVVFAGALTPWSGIEETLRAVGSPNWPSDLRLVVAGDGGSRADVESQAQIRDDTDFLGVLDYAQVPALLAGAQVILSPNTRRTVGGSPLKLYEAMASGRPVVATDVPGQAEIVRAARCGLLVPPGGTEAIARSVAELAANPDLRRDLGRNGRQTALAEHSWAARAAAVSTLLVGTRNV